MKANEAPEKIYLVRTTRIIDEWRKEQSQYGHNIEYTRTDAFIEKACDFIANNMRCNGYTLQTKAKFIRDFKKYMKGE